jgi:hypothetical protein
MFTSQSGNHSEGHIVGGNQTNNVTNIYSPPSPLAKLYEQMRDTSASQGTSEISDQLRHFCTALTEGDVRGLEAKLIAAGRSDLISPATHMKEFATKLIMKWQTSRAAQDVLTYVMARMFKDFLLHVTPAIQDGKSRQEVDALINDCVITPAEHLLGENTLQITGTDLLGLVFFLGGNCHIRWDKC